MHGRNTSFCITLTNEGRRIQRSIAESLADTIVMNEQKSQGGVVVFNVAFSCPPLFSTHWWVKGFRPTSILLLERFTKPVESGSKVKNSLWFG